MNDLQKYRQDFINNLIDTCLHGGGEVSIENHESRKTRI
jgi:hypothetical protein